MKPSNLALAALVLGLASTTAQAAPITLDYHVSTNFGPMAPVSPVAFTFHLTLDNDVSVTDETTGLTVTGLNIPLGSTPAFSYNATTDGLEIFGLQNGSNFSSGTDDFLVQFVNVSTSPVLGEFYYVLADAPRGVLFHSDGGIVTPVTTSGDSTGDVPEPLGLLAVGAALTGLRRVFKRTARA
jgi:hypothetical protein